MSGPASEERVARVLLPLSFPVAQSCSGSVSDDRTVLGLFADLESTVALLGGTAGSSTSMGAGSELAAPASARSALLLARAWRLVT